VAHRNLVVTEVAFLTGVHGGRRLRVPLMATVALMLLATGCDWAQFRFGAEHSGYTPTETMISAANVGQLTQKWTFRSGGPVESSPAVVGGVVYFGSEDDKVYALNATTGALVWSVPTGGAVLESPAVVNGVVYVGSADHMLYALDAGTGALRWSVRVDDNYATFDINQPAGNVNAGTLGSSPTVAGGTVYVVSSGVTGSAYEPYFLYAYDASSGALRWHAQMPLGSACKFDICPWAAPAVANGFIYVNNWAASEAQSFNATTGAFVWRAQFGQPLPPPPPGPHVGVTSPAVVNGRVYAAVCCAAAWVLFPATSFYALDAATGATVWLGTPSGVVYSSAAVADRIYAPGRDATVSAVDSANGTVVWSTRINDPILSSPAVANGVIFASSGLPAGGSPGALYAFDAKTGAQLWSGADNGGVSSPAVANGMVYVGNDDLLGALNAYGLSPSR
jgi:eukaryotic-like serine/threonine-protein kinase